MDLPPHEHPCHSSGAEPKTANDALDPAVRDAFTATVTQFNKATTLTLRLLFGVIAGLFGLPMLGWIGREVFVTDLSWLIEPVQYVLTLGCFAAIIFVQGRADWGSTLRCPSCGGSTVTRGGRFCPICGAEAAAKRFFIFRACAACRQPLMTSRTGGPAYTLTFCGSCGVRLHESGYKPVFNGLRALGRAEDEAGDAPSV